MCQSVQGRMQSTAVVRKGRQGGEGEQTAGLLGHLLLCKQLREKPQDLCLCFMLNSPKIHFPGRKFSSAPTIGALKPDIEHFRRSSEPSLAGGEDGVPMQSTAQCCPDQG